MSILGYKIINLYKVKTAIGSSAEEYEADITDEKMQEIATALGCNLQIMTSGSKWLLYKGTNTDNGWLCQIVSNYFEVRRYLNGQVTTSSTTGTNLQCRVQFTVSTQVKKLVLRYSKGKNGATIFEFTNYENVNLAYCIADASVIGTDEKISVYGYISAGTYMLSLSDSTSVTYNLSNVYGFADNLVLMGAIALKDKNAIIDGLYRCDINKNTDDHYVFGLDKKKYMASDGGAHMKWAIELDDSMLE
ncbi:MULTISPECIES: hypothetical protein [unclassified Clostridium]|uniref:hypothetical protein n=1 Tax=unclassified Clostridium TaxID=2614128 RepID=UPI000E4EC50B|nr:MULTISPECIES: hypothetical protein [unclassified Clostridium]RHP94187.1 hypothetical protein DXA07_04420 [Clostridium sp. AM54-37XD]RHP98267.1 hypothetical protein DXA00_01295 [Clostridium sp. AM54-14XD]